MRKMMWAIAVLPLLITAAAIEFLPDKVPAHYGITGTPDRWGNKYELFLFPAVILLMTGIIEIFAYLYEHEIGFTKKRHSTSARENSPLFRKTGLIAAVIMCAMQIVFIIKACAEGHAGINNLDIDMNRVSAVLLGILIIAVSNYMPKTRRNPNIGFRCTWTLYNDTTWQKSNRFAAAAMTVAGLCGIVSASFAGGVASMLLTAAYVIAAVVISMVYAKKVYDEEKAKEDTRS